MKLVVQEFWTLGGVGRAPVVVGQGRRLVRERGAPAGLRLVDHQATLGGLTVHIFETTGDPEFGTYPTDT